MMDMQGAREAYPTSTQALTAVHSALVSVVQSIPVMYSLIT